MQFVKSQQLDMSVKWCRHKHTAQ